MREVVHRYHKAKQPLCFPKVDPYKVVVSLCGGWGALVHVRSQSYSPHLQPSHLQPCNLAASPSSHHFPSFGLFFIIVIYLLSLTTTKKMTKEEGTVTSSSQSTSEMNSPEQTPGASKAPSKAQSIDEERPSGPLRRDSLASLSVAREPCGWVEPEEPTWPSGWKPYACLFGGFLLMFNSWGIVNVSSADCEDDNRACAD